MAAYVQYEVSMRVMLGLMLWIGGLGASLALAQDGELRLRVAKKLADKGQVTQALQEVRLHLAENPQSSAGYRLQGEMLLKLGKKPEAAESFSQALAQNPKDSAAALGLARSKPEPQAKAETKAEAKAEARVESKAKPAPQAQVQAQAKTEAKATDPKYQDRDFQAAVDLYREGKKAAAQQKLRSVLGRYPNHAGAYYLGGVIRYEAGEFDKAAYNFKRAFDYPERGYNAHFYLGRIYQKVGRVPEAIAELEAYMRSTPSDEGRERAEKLLAELKQARSEPKPSTEAKVVAPSPAPAKIADSIPEAISKSALDSAPDSAHAASDSSKHAQQAKPKTQVAAPKAGATPLEDGFLFLIADSTSEGGRKLMQAQAFYRRDRLEQAVQALKEVVRDFGGTENADVARLDLAAIYLRMRLYSDAKNQLEAFASSVAEGGQKYFDLAHYLLGRAHLGEGKPEDLEKAERYLLKVKPDRPLGPSGAERNWQLALAGEKMPDPVKRATYLAQALASHPSGFRHVYLQVKLGLHEAQFGKPAAGLVHFDAARSACGNGNLPAESGQYCLEAGVRAADMAFRLKDFKNAADRYQAFLKQNPKAADAPWAMYQVGNALKAQGRHEQALNQYQKVIDNFPENYWAAQAKWQREDVIWQKEFAEVLD